MLNVSCNTVFQLRERVQCLHPLLFAGICTKCGADLTNTDQTTSTMVVSTIPELKISHEVRLDPLHQPSNTPHTKHTLNI
jgi:hypothetical protein